LAVGSWLAVISPFYRLSAIGYWLFLQVRDMDLAENAGVMRYVEELGGQHLSIAGQPAKEKDCAQAAEGRSNPIEPLVRPKPAYQRRTKAAGRI
jgi:hypothetical protein